MVTTIAAAQNSLVGGPPPWSGLSVVRSLRERNAPQKSTPSIITTMNPTKLYLSLPLLLVSSAIALANPEVPGAKQAGPIALTGATVHPVSGPAIEEATLLFNKGKIVAVGKNVKIPDGAETIDVSGKHIYPALFDANTELGLVEISAVRATVDVRETGTINPNVRALVAVNPDSEVIPVTREQWRATRTRLAAWRLGRGPLGGYHARRLDVGRHGAEGRCCPAYLLAADACCSSIG